MTRGVGEVGCDGWLGEEGRHRVVWQERIVPFERLGRDDACWEPSAGEVLPSCAATASVHLSECQLEKGVVYTKGCEGVVKQ